MGLETYHRKGDFKKTPEPEGQVARRERRRSAPLDWAEVKRQKVTPRDFTIENMRKRIKRKGDLFMTAPKRPFDIDQVIRRIRVAMRPFPKAAMFELADDGFNSPFEQLVACIISIRTRDEVTVPTARKLFERARTPLEVSRLTSREINQLIRACTFHERKAQQILRIARRVVDEYEGALPCEAEALLSFEGVGPKCANLVLGIACGQARV